MFRYGHAIRPAHPSEAPLLTEIALAAKAHWGYDAAFMARAAPELRIRPEQIAGAPFSVFEDEGRLVGFYGLGGQAPVIALDYLFVTPERIGTGVGRALWEHAVATARAAGAVAIELESEPNAEGFYRSRGARKVGVVTSSLGRALPLLRFELVRTAAACSRSIQISQRPDCD